MKITKQLLQQRNAELEDLINATIDQIRENKALIRELTDQQINLMAKKDEIEDLIEKCTKK